jgi:hypothetical protein
MREKLAKSSDLPRNPGLLTFPDPLSPPTGLPVTKRTTRSRKINKVPETVVVSSQMIPVLVALVEVAMQTDLVREDLEAAIKDGKERIKETRDDCRDQERKAIEETEAKATYHEVVFPPFAQRLLHHSLTRSACLQIKAKREAHQQLIQDLESALKLVMHAYSPRFEPLGRDADGRTYWALTPGATERERALELLLSGKENSVERKSKRGKKKKKKKVGIREDRQAMKDWSLFVAVWGQRPPLAETANLTDEDEEGWWGFGEPSEVRNLAGWIGRRAGLQEDDAETKQTVKSLQEYADLLEWRIRKGGDHED